MKLNKTNGCELENLISSIFLQSNQYDINQFTISDSIAYPKFAHRIALGESTFKPIGTESTRQFHWAIMRKNSKQITFNQVPYSADADNAAIMTRNTFENKHV